MKKSVFVIYENENYLYHCSRTLFQSHSSRIDHKNDLGIGEEA